MHNRIKKLINSRLKTNTKNDIQLKNTHDNKKFIAISYIKGLSEFARDSIILNFQWVSNILIG